MKTKKYNIVVVVSEYNKIISDGLLSGAQIAFDDNKGKTLIASSTLDKNIKSKFKNTGNKEAASEIGKILAEKAKQKGINKVIFDRGRYLYHGRIKALADGARKAGLDF